MHDVALMDIPIAAVQVIDGHNPRASVKVDPSLRASIEHFGILQPLVVRQTGQDQYHLLAGHRRLAAARELGLETVPCKIVECDQRDAAAITHSENVDRENLSPIEEAESIERMHKAGWTLREIALARKCTEQWVARRWRLMSLLPFFQKAMRPGGQCEAVPLSVMEAVAALPQEVQGDLAEEIKKHEWVVDDKLRTLAAFNSYMQQEFNRLLGVPWALDDPNVAKGVGSCDACTKRQSANPLLFDDPDSEAKGDRCLDSKCFAKKAHATLERIVAKERAASKAEGGTGKILGIVVSYNNRSAANALGTIPVYGHEVVGAKKSDPKGVRAVNIDGPHVGKTRRVTLRADLHRISTAGTRPPKPLAEKRKALHARRRAHFITTIQRQVRAVAMNPDELRAAIGPVAQSIDDLHRMLLTYGANLIATDIGVDPDKVGKLSGADLTLAAWSTVLCTAADELNPRDPFGQDVDEEDARRVGAAIQLDLDSLWNQSVDKHPEPKAWSKNTEPKAGSSSRKAKKTQKKKVSPKKRVK